VQQREALVLQLVCSDLDGVRVRNLELDARLRYQTISRPVRGAEAGLRSLSQRPDAEGLTTVDVFTVQIAVTFRWGQG